MIVNGAHGIAEENEGSEMHIDRSVLLILILVPFVVSACKKEDGSNLKIDVHCNAEGRLFAVGLIKGAIYDSSSCIEDNQCELVEGLNCIAFSPLAVSSKKWNKNYKIVESAVNTYCKNCMGFIQYDGKMHFDPTKHKMKCIKGRCKIVR